MWSSSTIAVVDEVAAGRSINCIEGLLF